MRGERAGARTDTGACARFAHGGGSGIERVAPWRCTAADWPAERVDRDRLQPTSSSRRACRCGRSREYLEQGVWGLVFTYRPEPLCRGRHGSLSSRRRGRLPKGGGRPQRLPTFWNLGTGKRRGSWIALLFRRSRGRGRGLGVDYALPVGPGRDPPGTKRRSAGRFGGRGARFEVFGMGWRRAVGSF